VLWTTGSVSKKAAGSGAHVRTTLPDGTVDRIEGFATEGDAGRWIKNESAVLAAFAKVCHVV
jgi:hypothetical protein